MDNAPPPHHDLWQAHLREKRDARRQELTSRSLSSIAERLRDMQQGRARPSQPLTHLHQPPALPLSAPVQLLSKEPPYALGTPDPELTISTNPAFPGTINSEAYGDAQHGKLSVGVYGGHVVGAGFGGGGVTDFPMPERWLLGDAISAHAAIIESAPMVTPVKRGASFLAEVAFGWAPELPINFEVPSPLEECMNYYPGTSDSPMSGLIAITAFFEVAATLLAGSEVLASNAVWQNILTLAVDSELTGGAPDISNGKYVVLDWAFESDVNASVSVPVALQPTLRPGTPPDRIVVEGGVVLIGLRAGLNAEGAGRVGAGFIALGEGAHFPEFIAELVAPFAVRRISAYML